MTNFQKAFEAGQEAATKSELARKEIDAVFVALREEVSTATKGKIEVSKHEYEKIKSLNFTIMGGFEKETFWAIAARNPLAADKEFRQLARWEQAPAGYPCKISWAGVDNNCHDKESLERGLTRLLADAAIGEKLRGIMALPAASP